MFTYYIGMNCKTFNTVHGITKTHNYNSYVQYCMYMAMHGTITEQLIQQVEHYLLQPNLIPTLLYRKYIC